MGMWRGLVAPKGTPPDAVKKLHDAFKQGMDDPVFKKNAKEWQSTSPTLARRPLENFWPMTMSFFGKLIKEMKK